MRFFLDKKGLCLLLLLVIALIVRLWRLEFPAHLLFDETYHIPAARLIANNDPRAYEWWHQPIYEDYHDWLHPPAAKLMQAGAICLLGDSPLAWRLPSTLAAVLLIAAVYVLAQQVFSVLHTSDKTNSLSCLAAFLTSLSGLVLVQSRIGMNDIFLVLWLVLGLVFLYRWQPSLIKFNFDLNKQQKHSGSVFNFILAGLFLGLALATKWTALFLIGFLLIELCWLIVENKIWKFLPITLFSLVIVPLVVYLASYSQMFMQGKSLSHFVDLHHNILWYQFNRSEGHDYASTPAEWLINLRPVLYWSGQQSESLSLSPSKTANIYALENPVLILISLFALLYILGLIIKDNFQTNHSKVYLNLVMMYGMLWLPWLAAPRVMFFYHYLPAIPLLSLLVAEFLYSYLRPVSKLIYWLILILLTAGFIIFYPHWTGLTVSNDWAQAVYFALSSWQ
jgi:dolichyl-phosphate-mannose--protein O-mannosyl transferase